MKKMQKEMKDVELQLGIFANQVWTYSIYVMNTFHVLPHNTIQVSQLVKTRQEKMASADESRHSIEDDLWKIVYSLRPVIIYK